MFIEFNTMFQLQTINAEYFHFFIRIHLKSYMHIEKYGNEYFITAAIQQEILLENSLINQEKRQNDRVSIFVQIWMRNFMQIKQIQREYSVNCFQMPNWILFIQILFKIQNKIKNRRMSKISVNVDRNYGGRILVMQLQSSHQRNLSSIYSKHGNNYCSTPSLPRGNSLHNKQKIHQNAEHRNNIKHLFNFISRKKNMSDRYKDPHDFFAYPVYFFRQAPNYKQTKISKKAHKQKIRKLKSQQSEYSQQSQFTRRYGIDLPTVKKNLPALEHYDDSQLRRFGESIIKMVENYNINTLDKLQFLRECVLKTRKNDKNGKKFEETTNQYFDILMKDLNKNNK